MSLAVSEQNWKGKISNIESSLNIINEKYIVNGEKSFITNGAESDYFLVVLQFDTNYKLVLLNKEIQGLEIEPFHLSFVKNSTHCRIKMKNIQIEKEQILDIDYSKVSESIRFTELLSLSSIFIGYANTLTMKLNELEPSDELQIYKILHTLDRFEAHILKISRMKDSDLNLNFKTFYPFGTEFIVEEFYEKLTLLFSKELILNNDLENKLFTGIDFYNTMLIKKAAKRRILGAASD